MKRIVPETFSKIKNKIPGLSRTTISEQGADPWVIFWEGNYYYTRSILSDGYSIYVNKASRLEDIGLDNHVVWQEPSGDATAEVWAPELHRVNDKWYIYFTMGEELDHRMYVLEGVSDDPQGEYVFKGKLKESSEQWAIDGTVFKWKNHWYTVWSGYETAKDRTQNLYIARMDTPLSTVGDRVGISRPIFEWEQRVGPYWPINEGPQALEHNGKLFIIYSASHSVTDDYCLGQLELVGDDPLLPTSWIKKSQPVFSKHGSIYGPGHASFIEKPDGSDWIVYHSTRESNVGWDGRLLRAQKFTWHDDGSPNFGTPREKHALTIVENLKTFRKHVKHV